MDRQLLVGDVVHPRAHHLADQLAARLATDGLGDHSNGILGLDEAEWHGDSPAGGKQLTDGTVGGGVDGSFAAHSPSASRARSSVPLSLISAGNPSVARGGEPQ